MRWSSFRLGGRLRADTLRQRRSGRGLHLGIALYRPNTPASPDAPDWPAAFQQVTLHPADGAPLIGMLALQPGNHPGVVVVHGFNTHGIGSVIRWAGMIYKNVYNVLAADQRDYDFEYSAGYGYPNFPQTFGWMEAQDVVAAGRYLRQQKGVTTVGVVGFSERAQDTVLGEDVRLGPDTQSRRKRRTAISSLCLAQPSQRKSGFDGARLAHAGAGNRKKVAGKACQILSDRTEIASALEASDLPDNQLPSVFTVVDQWRKRLLSEIEAAAALNPVVACCSNEDQKAWRRDASHHERNNASITKADSVLLKTIARAYHWAQDLMSGRMRSVEELAEHHQIGPRYVRRLLQVAFLAPKIVEGIAAGTQPQDLTAEALAERMHLPLLWTEQEQTVFAS